MYGAVLLLGGGAWTRPCVVGRVVLPRGDGRLDNPGTARHILVISLFAVKFPLFAVKFPFFVVNLLFAPRTNATGFFENFKGNVLYQSVMTVPANFAAPL